MILLHTMALVNAQQKKAILLIKYGKAALAQI